MKKKFIISIASAMAMSVLVIPFASMAEDEMVYGTMNIPYADFYASEFGEIANAYEVDAMSSATTAKWSKNGEGELFEGTFNQANEDGTGSILGVTYPVAITQAELDSLGENNYGFTALDAEPSAYKTVTVADGKASFSAVQDSTPTVADGASIKLSTSTAWGDYLIDIENAPEMGAIYGALIRTSDGNTYAMRHEENIWRGELAWSSGIKTTEPHGNTLSYENFETLMGSTISEVVFITRDGYTTIVSETYVPVKFASEVSIDNSASGTGKTAMTLTGFPEDYEKNYSIADNFSVTDSEISYTDALAGSYTLTITDNAGKYAEITASFVLSTDSMPATYSDGKLVKAEGAEDADFANFVKNISTVSVNGTEYIASGRGAVKIIGEDGTVDFSASSRNENVFDGSGNYTITVNATGYNNPLGIEVKAEAPAPETTTNAPVTTTNAPSTTTKAPSGNTTIKNNSGNSKSTTTTAKSGTSSATESPKTGVAGVAVPMTTLA
ncbi:MAG: DUF1533 domain-containing protein, partial [Ruminococcus sp.]|nr:DUF1533 domain-containing protein [Ruminococcus sp.]